MIVHHTGRAPEYALPGDAGADLRAAEDVTVPSGHSRMVGTGVAVALPDGHAGLVLSRSGHGFKHGIRLANGVGLIDSGYRGEVMVALHNDGQRQFRVRRGDRIAQLVIVPVTRADFVAVDTLDETERGADGFGSTGTREETGDV